MSLESFENPKEFWKAVLGEVQMKISPMQFNTTFPRTKIDNVDDTTLTLNCDDSLVRNIIEKKHLKELNSAIEKIAGKPLKVICKIKKLDKQDKDNGSNLGPLFSPRDPNDLVEEKRTRSNLSSKLTFENYVMGNNNNLAYAIATAVADKPGELYNPFFLYSGVGLGKTHLLHAIGNKIIRDKPGMKVVYTTGETFTNELIESIQGGRGGKYTANAFRNKFRKADVFLIDDVQFVIGKASTQEEFFHTFNALFMANKQIVITSDRPPKDFNNIEERITSRFSSGIIADIQAPDLEMRTAILRKKRDFNKDLVPNEVIDFIAESVDSNIRELEGAYMQVLTSGKALGNKLDVDTAAKALGQLIREKPKNKKVNVNEILKAVCTYYAVKASDIKGKRRTKDLVLPRQVAMYLLKDITDLPLMGIGDFLGGRDHTTIMHGIDKIGTQVEERGKVAQDVRNVRQILLTD